MQTVIYDPTAADAVSAVRGVGRYLQLLREAFSSQATFTSSLDNINPHSVFVNTFFNVTQPPLVKNRVAKKQIALIHDVIPLEYPTDFPLGIRGNLNVFNNKRTLKHYDAFITSTEATKKTIQKHLNIPTSKIHIAYPCLTKNISETKPQKTTLSVPEAYFIYTGDATANKNIIAVAKSVKQIDTPVIFVGKVFTQERTDHPWNRELNEFMRYAEGDSRFIFAGYVPDSELKYLYSRAVANILISKDEGFGFSYLEAATCKTPSLLSDIPIFKETAQDSALFANPTNIEEITSLLKLLAAEKKLRNELAEKAYTRSKFFTPAAFKKAWEAVLGLQS